MVGEAHSSTGKPVVFCLRPHKLALRVFYKYYIVKVEMIS